MTFSIVLGIMAAVAATVLLCLKVLPEKFNGNFKKKPFQLIHDYFNFKKLYLESILKILFTFLSIACVAVGVLIILFGNNITLFGNIIEGLERGYVRDWVWALYFRNIISGLGIAVLGPIALRLIYEAAMMFILLVKNVIQINNKLKDSDKEN